MSLQWAEWWDGLLDARIDARLSPRERLRDSTVRTLPRNGDLGFAAQALAASVEDWNRERRTTVVTNAVRSAQVDSAICQGVAEGLLAARPSEQRFEVAIDLITAPGLPAYAPGFEVLGPHAVVIWGERPNEAEFLGEVAMALIATSC